MKILRAAAVCVGATALVVGGATAATAGEVNGKGEPTQGPAHSKSVCAFSGLNDDPDDPIEGGRVQSFGQIVRHAGPQGGANSVTTPFGEFGCNAKLYPMK